MRRNKVVSAVGRTLRSRDPVGYALLAGLSMAAHGLGNAIFGKSDKENRPKRQGYTQDDVKRAVDKHRERTKFKSEVQASLAQTDKQEHHSKQADRYMQLHRSSTDPAKKQQYFDLAQHHHEQSLKEETLLEYKHGRIYKAVNSVTGGSLTRMKMRRHASRMKERASSATDTVDQHSDKIINVIQPELDNATKLLSKSKNLYDRATKHNFKTKNDHKERIAINKEKVDRLNSTLDFYLKNAVKHDRIARDSTNSATDWTRRSKEKNLSSVKGFMKGKKDDTPPTGKGPSPTRSISSKFKIITDKPSVSPVSGVKKGAVNDNTGSNDNPPPTNKGARSATINKYRTYTTASKRA